MSFLKVTLKELYEYRNSGFSTRINNFWLKIFSELPEDKKPQLVSLHPQLKYSTQKFTDGKDCPKVVIPLCFTFEGMHELDYILGKHFIIVELE